MKRKRGFVLLNRPVPTENVCERFTPHTDFDKPSQTCAECGHHIERHKEND